MCGIAGYLSPGKKIGQQQLKAAAGMMHHRGPDATGYYFSEDETIGLAHHRLAVLDLSAAANQPLFSADGRYCIVFNGEIYNFNELKKQLPGGGANLRTGSDTEVILELFIQEGTACFSQLNGMFAFAIYETKEKRLTLCRDQAGIKPLFIYQDDHCILFASELKVIRHLLGQQLQLNKAAIPYFLHLGFIPQPLTIYQNTEKFPAAHYCQLSAAPSAGPDLTIHPIPFWQLSAAVGSASSSDEKTAKLQLQTLLLDAVAKQLVSDVPVGTFLSGGIDSSLVTAIAANLGGSQKIQSFSMAIDDGRYNESAYATKVAKHLGTIHHEFKVTEKEVLELVPQLLSVYDEPFADTSAFPTMMVSRLARKQVTVALSGDGGDELFHGYGMYTWANRLASPGWQLAKPALYHCSRFANSRYERIGDMFAPARGNLTSHIFSQEQYCFSQQELTELMVANPGDCYHIKPSTTNTRYLSPAEKQAAWDFEHYLKDDLLVKVDRASMHYSLECRVPLLDTRLVEFAFNLHPSLKIRDGVMKYLLKEVLYDFVPRSIFDRPKQGFSIPLDRWLKTDLKFLLDRYTAEAVITKHQIVHFSAVAQLKKRYLAGTFHLYNRLWLIVVLHWWLEEQQL